jgi:hypothetical protein
MKRICVSAVVAGAMVLGGIALVGCDRDSETGSKANRAQNTSGTGGPIGGASGRKTGDPLSDNKLGDAQTAGSQSTNTKTQTSGTSGTTEPGTTSGTNNARDGVGTTGTEPAPSAGVKTDTGAVQNRTTTTTNQSTGQ